MYVLRILSFLMFCSLQSFGADWQSDLTEAVNIFSVNPQKDGGLIKVLEGLDSIPGKILAVNLIDPTAISHFAESLKPMSDSVEKLAKVCKDNQDKERFNKSESCIWIRKTEVISKIREQGCRSAAKAMVKFFKSTSSRIELDQSMLDIENAMGRAASMLRHRNCKAIQSDLDLIRSKEAERDEVVQGYQLLLSQVGKLFSKSTSSQSTLACDKQRDQVFAKSNNEIGLQDFWSEYDRLHDWSVSIATFELACEDLKSRSKKTPNDYEAYCFALSDLVKWRLEKTNPKTAVDEIEKQVGAVREKCFSDVCAAFPDYRDPPGVHGMCFVDPKKATDINTGAPSEAKSEPVQ